MSIVNVGHEPTEISSSFMYRLLVQVNQMCDAQINPKNSSEGSEMHKRVFFGQMSCLHQLFSVEHPVALIEQAIFGHKTKNEFAYVLLKR